MGESVNVSPIVPEMSPRATGKRPEVHPGWGSFVEVPEWSLRD